MKLKLTVVVPHLNQPEELKRCLSSVCTQTLLRAEYEIVVVDNGSDDLPHSICEQFGARLICTATPGPGPARNAGVFASRAELLVFIDSDCIADRSWLSSALEKFADPSVKAVGGDVRISCKNADQMTAIEAYESVFGYRQKLYIERMGFSATLNFAVRKAVFESVGPFGGIEIAEDRDWGFRATKLGFAIDYLPEMIVYHPARKNISELEMKWLRHIIHDFAEINGSGMRLLMWYVKALAVAVSPAFDVLKILRSNRVTGLKSFLKASGVLFFIRGYRSFNMIRVHFQNGTSKTPKWNIGETHHSDRK